MTTEPEQMSPREAIREMDGATFDIALAWPTVELSIPISTPWTWRRTF